MTRHRQIRNGFVLLISIGISLSLQLVLPPELYIGSGGEAIVGGIILMVGIWLEDGWLVLPAPLLIVAGGIDSLAVLTNRPDIWSLAWPLTLTAVGIGVFMGSVVHHGPEKYVRLGSKWIGASLLLFISLLLLDLSFLSLH